jgi:hypothetical protein
MHPHLFPVLMAGCVKHRSKRSAIFDRATTRTLSRTPAVAGNRKTWSWSGWVKRGTLGILSGIFGASVGNATYYFWAYFDTDDKLKLGQFGVATTTQLSTTAVYRDPSAWMHILIVCDTTQATASERLRLYVNGQRITSFSAETYAAQNTDLVFNSNIPHRLGSGIDVDGGLYNAITCNLAEVHFTDGLVLQPGDVGATDWRSSNWMHKHYSGDHGAQGYYLPFIGDAGDSPAVVSEAAKDRAPITGAHVAANNWTANNFAATDFVKDTPTNYKSGTDYRGNFATLSPVARTNSSSFGICPISDGNLKASPTSALSALTSFALPRSGIFHWEIEFSSGGFAAHGIATASFLGGGNATGVFGWYGNGGNGAIHHLGTTSGADANSPNTVGDIAIHHLDITANKYWIGRRRAGVTTWMGGGDPAAGTNPTFSGPGGGGVYSTAMNLATGKWRPQVSGGGSWVAIVNFGQKAFADAPVAGALPLCVAAIAKPKFSRAGTAFARAYNTGANIESALAALRAGWSDFIEIFKRCDSAEGWRFRFSDDLANHLDSSTAVGGKAAFPALTAGGNYVGYAIRIGAAYGVVTGEIAHVNGAATTITDNLGTTRKAVILRRVDAGGAWPFSHPALTAGSLLYLNTNAGEAAATDITSITSNSVQIGAGQPTGSYRYLILSEASGLISLEEYGGNGSADGPSPDDGFAAAMMFWKRADSAGDYYLSDDARDAVNPRTQMIGFNSTGISSSAPSRAVDFLASGTKQRGSPVQTDANTSGARYVRVAFAASVFATGDCPAQGTAR